VKAYFFQRHRGVLFIFSFAALLLSLFLGFSLGTLPFELLALMSGVGILYSVQLIPRILKPIFKVRKLREIPGSKTLFVSIAWAFITVILPLLGSGAEKSAAAISWIFIFSLSLAYVRCSLFDVFDMQGDRIVGKETLPVLLGEKITLNILYGVLAFDICLITVPWAAGLRPAVFLLLLPAILLFFLLALLYEKKKLSSGPGFEFALDGVFLVLGVVAWFLNGGL
jgi:4-hydroxybenzoate polyprenyltransferase